METKPKYHPSGALRSILLLAGSFTFAFLLGEAVHEFGHYLCHLAYGNAEVSVHLDPLGGSHIVGVVPAGSRVEMGVTSAAGPLFNLALGLACFLLLRRTRRPWLLPLLLWGPLSMVQEGVTFSLGFLTPGGDARWIAESGAPAALVLIGGLSLLASGVAGITCLLPLAGLENRQGPWRAFAIVSAGMCSLLLLRWAWSLSISPALSTENLVPLLFSLLLALAVVHLRAPLARGAGWLLRQERPDRVTWSAIATALALGTAMFLVQVHAANLVIRF